MKIRIFRETGGFGSFLREATSKSLTIAYHPGMCMKEDQVTGLYRIRTDLKKNILKNNVVITDRTELMRHQSRNEFDERTRK